MEIRELSKKYIKIYEAASAWGLTPRRVQALCSSGKIAGAVRIGREWLIPTDTTRPIDGRTKSARNRSDTDMPLPRKTPFLYMSDLYSEPGTADEVAESLSYNHEAEVLFAAEVAYSRGQIERVYESASYLLKKHSGFYAIISGGMLLAMCAIWKGDIEMWRRAKVHISEAPAQTDRDRDIIELSISAVDIMLYNVESFPDWFKMGCFEPLDKDAFPAAKVYYAKYLYATAYALATGALKLDGVQGLSLMSLVPCSIEPLISWANANNTVISEIYLRLTCAAVYHNSGRDKDAIRHIDNAIALALPDKLYGVLAEYCRALDTLIEKRLSLIDPSAWERVRELYKVYNEGWLRLSGAIRGKRVIITLTPRQREIAKLAAFGMTNKEIAANLNMSLSGVKQALLAISDKLGVGRDQFAAYL